MFLDALVTPLRPAFTTFVSALDAVPVSAPGLAGAEAAVALETDSEPLTRARDRAARRMRALGVPRRTAASFTGDPILQELADEGALDAVLGGQRVVSEEETRVVRPARNRGSIVWPMPGVSR